MKRIRNILFGTLLFSLVAFTFMQTSVTSNMTIDLENLFSTNEALADDCTSWGYRTWNYWASGVDGVDCACNDREKVWNECPPKDPE